MLPTLANTSSLRDYVSCISFLVSPVYRTPVVVSQRARFNTLLGFYTQYFSGVPLLLVYCSVPASQGTGIPEK